MDLALKLLGQGNMLMVTWLSDLVNIVHELESRGAALQVIKQAIDIGTTAGCVFFSLLNVFTQFETDVRRERQLEGIVRTKASGERRLHGKLKYAECALA